MAKILNSASSSDKIPHHDVSSDFSFHTLPHGVSSPSWVPTTPEDPPSSDGNANDDFDQEQSDSSDDEEYEVE